MTRAQNREAQVTRELGLHSLVDAGTAVNRPNLEVWAWRIRALASLPIALARPSLSAGSALRSRRARERRPTPPPLTDLSLPTMPVGNSRYEAQAA